MRDSLTWMAAKMNVFVAILDKSPFMGCNFEVSTLPTLGDWLDEGRRSATLGMVAGYLG